MAAWDPIAGIDIPPRGGGNGRRRRWLDRRTDLAIAAAKYHWLSFGAEIFSSPANWQACQL
ncbi:MAG TPA: hypothetical protein VEP71_05335, partial [Gallionella sp.]|nr:hypothetical protein [Gallionella sp.]